MMKTGSSKVKISFNSPVILTFAMDASFAIASTALRMHSPMRLSSPRTPASLV